MTSKRGQAIETHPLTPDRWRDFAALMNSKYYTRRCWCMAPRREVSYHQFAAESNRRSIKKVVDTAPAPPGVLAYIDGEPAGWCAVAPRDEFPRIARARSGARETGAVWSVVCFYVLHRARRQGVSRALLAAAVELAAQQGASAVEAYPVEGGNNPYRGLPSVYFTARFREIDRLRANRPVLRRKLPVRRAKKPA